MMAVVAELMIAANSAVAERIYAAFPGAALLRRHPPPRPEAFAEVPPLGASSLGHQCAASFVVLPATAHSQRLGKRLDLSV